MPPQARKPGARATSANAPARGAPSRGAPGAPSAPEGSQRPSGAAPAGIPSNPADRARHVELILSKVESLPTLSPIATRLLALTSADDSDFDEIIALIEADLSLTAKMIALCRRASAGVAETVTTVRRAVVLLGLEAVQSAVLSVSVFDVLSGSSNNRAPKPGDAKAFDHVGFWQHSVAVACCAELLARQHPTLKVRPDEAFTAGLVHDLGKVALEWILPQTYPRVLDLAETRSCDLAAAERSVMGVDHHITGKRLAEHWGLPYSLADTMWLHGQPTSALPDVPHRSLIGLVTAADAIARRLHLGWSGNCAPAPGIDYIVQCVDIEADRVASIEPRLHETLAQRCADLGLADLSSPELMMQSIASANARLQRLTQSMARRAQAAKGQAAGMELISGFLSRAGPSTSLEQALSAIAWSVGRLGMPGTPGTAPQPRQAAAPAPAPVLFVWQERSDADWTLAIASTDGKISMTCGAPGPGSLSETARDSSMAASADLLGWLVKLLDPGVKLDLRKLRRVPILLDQESAVVMLLDREVPEAIGVACATGSSGQPFADAVAGAWAGASRTAIRQAGARRLSESLAQTNRMLIDTQQELADAQSMVRLGELTAGAAHEMNNPLTVISGRSQLLSSRLKDPRDREDASAIATAAVALTDLITGLHTLANPPAIKRQGVNLRDLLEQCAKRAKARAGASHAAGYSPPPIRISISSPIDLAAVDPTLFGRAIEEVLLNALQSQPGSISINATASLAEDVLKLTISDDGCGMSAHAIEHAFDPFFSEQPAGRRTGLGLPIARRFIGLHSGDVALRSATDGPEKGTVVAISLPRWRHRSAAPIASAA